MTDLLRRRIGVLVAVAAMSGAPLVAAGDGGPSAGVLSLRAAVSEALERGPLLIASVHQQRTAEVRHDAAQAAFGVRLTPTLTSAMESVGLVRQSLGIGVAKRLPTGADIMADTSSFRYAGPAGDHRDIGFSVQMSQPLLSGFGTVARADLDIARRGVESAQRGAAAARQRAIVTVADAFFAVVRQERVLDVSGRAHDRASTLREATEARKETGLATELDALRARLLMSQAAAAMGRDREALEAARDRLRHVLGRPLDAPVDIDGVIPEVLRASQPLDPLHIDALVHEAVSRRSETEEARAHIVSARRAADVARWQVLPPVTLDVGYSRRGTWAGGPVLFDRGWFVGISSGAGVSLGASRAALQNAALAVAAAERQARDAEMRVVMEVRAAARTVARTADAVALADEAVEVSRQQRELVDLRFQRGLATSLDVVEAETMLYQTETTAVAARIEHALARLSLDRAAGVLDPQRWMQ